MKKKLLSLFITTLVLANAAFAEYSFVSPEDFTGDAFFTPPAFKLEEEKPQNTQGSRDKTTPPVKQIRLLLKNKMKERSDKKMQLAPVAPQEDDIFAAGAETSEYASKEIEEHFDEDMMPDGFEADEESVAEQKNQNTSGAENLKNKKTQNRKTPKI